MLYDFLLDTAVQNVGNFLKRGNYHEVLGKKFGLATIFQLPPELVAGVILVGTCPGGTASNVMTFLAKGDLALSVSVSMASTILAPIVTPLLTWALAGAWIDVSFVDMMFSIVQVVIALKLAGVWARAAALEPAKLNIVVAVNAARILDTGLLVMLVVVLHNLCGYGLGFCAAKLFGMNIAKTKAISIEVGMQNSGLAVSLAMTHFSAAAAIPGAVFSVWHNISGSIAANIMAQKSNNDS